LLQLDGDVLTVFRKDTVADSEFENLARQHFDAVESALAVLASFSSWIKRASKFCVGIGLISWGLTGYWSYADGTINVSQFLPGTSFALTVTLIGLTARRSSMSIVRWWARRLTARARIEAEVYGMKKLVGN
jgi:hypothetical protein